MGLALLLKLVPAEAEIDSPSLSLYTHTHIHSCTNMPWAFQRKSSCEVEHNRWHMALDNWFTGSQHLG